MRACLYIFTCTLSHTPTPTQVCAAVGVVVLLQVVVWCGSSWFWPQAKSGERFTSRELEGCFSVSRAWKFVNCVARKAADMLLTLAGRY